MRPESRVGFKTTAWTMIDRLREAEGADRDAAVSELAKAYWPPVYAYLRRRGRPPEEAADHAQEFFLFLLQKDLLEHADQAKGRFRSYLLTILENFLANQARIRNAKKRGGGGKRHLDVDRLEPWLASTQLTPEQAFDHQWAVDVLARAMLALGKEIGAERFTVLRRHIAPAEKPPSYGESASELGVSEAAFTSSLHRARQRLRELVRLEVGPELPDLIESLR